VNVVTANRRARRSARWTARIGVVALIASAFVLATATSVWADAPDVSTTTGTELDRDLVNGTVTVEVSGTWAWPTHKKDCNTDRFAAGWAVDWNDDEAAGNPVAVLNGVPIDVGVLDGTGTDNTTDNAVHIPSAPPLCGVFGPHGALSYNTGAWGPLQHTYVVNGGDPATDQEINDFLEGLSPCAVMYDVHSDATKELTAGGTGHNGDNSVEKNKQTPAGNVCAAIDVEPIPPDVSVVKTGPAQVTVGETFAYTLTVTNDGEVDVVASLTDQLPAGVSYVSSSAQCHQDDEDPTIVACAIGLLHPNDSVQVQITVLATTAGTVVNTGVVTPDDETPDDNTSSVTTLVVEPAAAGVAVTPTFTG
jgi:uncharacterized repeat protein (TIGR01451 family)